MSFECGVCGSPAALWNVVDGIDYGTCDACGCIAMERRHLELVDEGSFERKYDASYWADEEHAARERSWGSSLARSAEAILLCERPVGRFLDIGSGTGHLLDALSYYLPSSRERFYGIERFPPSEHSAHPNFTLGTVSDLSVSIDAGVCVEVIEHLTPTMLKNLVQELALVANPNAFFIFNTGLPKFVNEECPSYMDPFRRGHIVSWGWQALREIFEPEGFKVHRLGDREWAFAAEFMPIGSRLPNQRLWQPLAENLGILTDPATGSAMHILARESLRVAGY